MRSWRSGYRIAPNLEIRGSGQLRRYFYDMHSKAGDAFLAGGAIDQYWTVGLGMAVLLGGSEGPAAPLSLSGDGRSRLRTA